MKVAGLRRLFGPALAGALALAGATAWSSPGQAEVINALFGLRLDGMSTGTCAGTICPESFGYVHVTGNTDSSLTYTVVLAPDVSFHSTNATSFNVLFFDLTDPGGGPITRFRTFRQAGPGIPLAVPHSEVMIPKM
jgi:hypothetical protein